MPAKVEPTPPLAGLSPVAGKPLIARFDGGQLSSDGGLLALRRSSIGSASPTGSPPASTIRARPRVLSGLAPVEPFGQPGRGW
jgi:hypothetical protein